MDAKMNAEEALEEIHKYLKLHGPQMFPAVDRPLDEKLFKVIIDQDNSIAIHHGCQLISLADAEEKYFSFLSNGCNSLSIKSATKQLIKKSKVGDYLYLQKKDETEIARILLEYISFKTGCFIWGDQIYFGADIEAPTAKEYDKVEEIVTALFYTCSSLHEDTYAIAELVKQSYQKKSSILKSLKKNRFFFYSDANSIRVIQSAFQFKVNVDDALYEFSPRNSPYSTVISKLMTKQYIINFLRKEQTCTYEKALCRIYKEASIQIVVTIQPKTVEALRIFVENHCRSFIKAERDVMTIIRDKDWDLLCNKIARVIDKASIDLDDLDEVTNAPDVITCQSENVYRHDLLSNKPKRQNVGGHPSKGKSATPTSQATKQGGKINTEKAGKNTKVSNQQKSFSQSKPIQSRPTQSISTALQSPKTSIHSKASTHSRSRSSTHSRSSARLKDSAPQKTESSSYSGSKRGRRSRNRKNINSRPATSLLNTLKIPNKEEASLAGEKREENVPSVETDENHDDSTWTQVVKKQNKKANPQFNNNNKQNINNRPSRRREYRKRNPVNRVETANSDMRRAVGRNNANNATAARKVKSKNQTKPRNVSNVTADELQQRHFTVSNKAPSFEGTGTNTAPPMAPTFASITAKKSAKPAGNLYNSDTSQIKAPFNSTGSNHEHQYGSSFFSFSTSSPSYSLIQSRASVASGHAVSSPVKPIPTSIQIPLYTSGVSPNSILNPPLNISPAIQNMSRQPNPLSFQISDSVPYQYPVTNFPHPLRMPSLNVNPSYPAFTRAQHPSAVNNTLPVKPIPTSIQIPLYTSGLSPNSILNPPLNISPAIQNMSRQPNPLSFQISDSVPYQYPVTNFPHPLRMPSLNVNPNFPTFIRAQHPSAFFLPPPPPLPRMFASTNFPVDHANKPLAVGAGFRGNCVDSNTSLHSISSLVSTVTSQSAISDFNDKPYAKATVEKCFSDTTSTRSEQGNGLVSGSTDAGNEITFGLNPAPALSQTFASTDLPVDNVSKLLPVDATFRGNYVHSDTSLGSITSSLLKVTSQSTTSDIPYDKAIVEKCFLDAFTRPEQENGLLSGSSNSGNEIAFDPNQIKLKAVTDALGQGELHLDILYLRIAKSAVGFPNPLFASVQALQTFLETNETFNKRDCAISRNIGKSGGPLRMIS